MKRTRAVVNLAWTCPTAATGIGSASPILETGVERDEDSASQASTTPTQTVPSVNANVEMCAEDVNGGAHVHKPNPRESFVSFFFF